MRKSLFFIFLITLFFTIKVTQVNAVDSPVCTRTISTSTSLIDGSNINPGEVVCLAPGSRSRLSINNVHGTSTNPIIFINLGGIVVINNNGYSGIEVKNSQHIRITGTGVSNNCGSSFSEEKQECGIQIDSSGAGTAGRGISGESKTEYIEIDHIEIANSGESGITIKTKDFNRTMFTQRNTKIYNNYIHDITIDEGSEGMYIGSSDYSVGIDPLLVGVDIGYNLVARTGWDGIQVGSAVENCTIHHNIVLNDSVKNAASQNLGIINNRGSVCDIYNNILLNGNGEYGIYVQGNGLNKIYNNAIANRLNSAGSGIKISQGSNTQNGIKVWNNTIVNVADKGINFSNGVGTDNQVINNFIIQARGTALSSGTAKANNNLIKTNVSEAKFVNSAALNFAVNPDSPAIDAGTNVPISYDFLGNHRPSGPNFDIGAYEYQSSISNKPGDVDGSGRVDIVDIGIAIDNYGKTPPPNPKADVNNDGMTNIIDIGIIIDNYE